MTPLKGGQKVGDPPPSLPCSANHTRFVKRQRYPPPQVHVAAIDQGAILRTGGGMTAKSNVNAKTVKVGEPGVRRLGGTGGGAKFLRP